MYALDAYRSLYEGAEKRLMKFRDLAAKPDLPSTDMNKDRYPTLEQAMRDFKSRPQKSDETFVEWLFTRVPVLKDGVEI